MLAKFGQDWWTNDKSESIKCEKAQYCWRIRENSEFGEFDLQPDLLTSVTFTLKILLLTVHISHENISVIIS